AGGRRTASYRRASVRAGRNGAIATAVRGGVAAVRGGVAVVRGGVTAEPGGVTGPRCGLPWVRGGVPSARGAGGARLGRQGGLVRRPQGRRGRSREASAGPAGRCPPRCGWGRGVPGAAGSGRSGARPARRVNGEREVVHVYRERASRLPGAALGANTPTGRTTSG